MLGFNVGKWCLSFDAGVIVVLYLLCITSLLEMSKGGRCLSNVCSESMHVRR